MKPIIFLRTSSMYYYKGTGSGDIPQNGGEYVNKNHEGGECFNFDAVNFDDGATQCLGYVMLMGRSSDNGPQIRIENIVGCNLLKKEEFVDDVTVVWCAKANGCKSTRVVGFYKHATVFRHMQRQDFPGNCIQEFSAIADKENCVLLPWQERFGNSNWYVPQSGKNGSSFGFGRSNVWFAGSNTDNKKELEYVEKMLKNIDEYNGKNWIDERGEQ